MNPKEAAQAAATLPLSSSARRQCAPLHNERVLDVKDQPGGAAVVLQAWKGNETSRGIRVVTLAAGTDGALDVVNEHFIATPGTFTARTGSLIRPERDAPAPLPRASCERIDRGPSARERMA